MERIIIREVDNTSNVEALSSYDVAYVPGFALGPEDTAGNRTLNESLYRVPTLIKDKYEFIKTFGPTCPTFSSRQPYPSEFPDRAIKWGDTSSSYYLLQVNKFDDTDDIQDSGWYSRIYDVPTGDNTAIKQYYLAQYSVKSSKYELTPIGATVSQAYSHETDNLVSAFGKDYFTATFTQVVYETGDDPLDHFQGRYESAGTITEFDSKITYYTKDGDDYTEAEEYVSGTDYYVFNFSSSVTYFVKSNNPVKYTVSDPQTFKDGTTYYYADGGVTPFAGTTFETGVTYYEYKPFEQTYTVTTDTTPVKGNSDKYVFTSTIVPANVWYSDDSGTASSDTFINPESTYYGFVSDGIQPMFEGPQIVDGVTVRPGDADPGYRYALTLLSLGMPVYFEQMNNSENDINVSKMYAGLRARFIDEPSSEDYAFDSMGDYNVKFITSGGYPTFEYANNALANAMITMAKTRKDSIALIDHTDNPSRDLTTYSSDSVISSVRNWNVGEDGTFGALFTPWYECTHLAVTHMQNDTDAAIPNVMMPASLAYLTSLSVQLQNYNPWLAVSGVVRGMVPFCGKLHTDKPLTNHIADSYQALPNTGTIAISINPITYIRNYGYCLWGNRTLRNNSSGTKASSFLNIRSAVSDIKKRLYEASQQILFEQNTDVTWLNFKSLILPLLETMVSDYILEDYAVTRLYTDPNTGYPVPAYEIMAVIRIQPINSVEVFDLTIYMENTDDFSITTTESEG